MEILYGCFSSDSTTEGDNDNKPKHLKVPQSFSHGRLADVEVTRNSGLNNAITRSAASLENVLNEIISDLFAKYTTVDRRRVQSSGNSWHECVSCGCF